MTHPTPTPERTPSTPYDAEIAGLLRQKDNQGDPYTPVFMTAILTEKRNGYLQALAAVAPVIKAARLMEAVRPSLVTRCHGDHETPECRCGWHAFAQGMRAALAAYNAARKGA